MTGKFIIAGEGGKSKTIKTDTTIAPYDEYLKSKIGLAMAK